MSTAIYSHPDCSLHEMGDWHPESPARLQAIEDQLILARLDGLIERRGGPPAERDRDPAQPQPAGALDLVRDNLPGAGEYLSARRRHPAVQAQLPAALRAAGLALAATDAVIAGDGRQRLLRDPPARPPCAAGEPMGFCLFNNVAIAARHALEVHGLERVAIVDFDVHHGNGTEESFRDDPRVLMASFFQHPFYPYTEPAR
jgi:acetoin utilization deacetylase AcuC-like enzyme